MSTHFVTLMDLKRVAAHFTDQLRSLFAVIEVDILMGRLTV